MHVHAHGDLKPNAPAWSHHTSHAVCTNNVMHNIIKVIVYYTLTV